MELWDEGFVIEGGRCLGPMWWCRIESPSGMIVLRHGWTPKIAGYAAVDGLGQRGFALDAESRDAIVEGLKLQVFGR